MVFDMDVYPLSLTQEDYIHACEVTDCWNDNGIEPPVRYIIRKRTVDMARLINEAIENELTESERTTIRLMYFENKKPAEIAQEAGINRASVCRTALRARNKLHSALKYAVMYISDIADSTLTAAAIAQSAQTARALSVEPKSLAQRLCTARTSQALSVDTLADAIGLTAGRIREIENGSSEPSAHELMRYCAFFSLSADKLLNIL